MATIIIEIRHIKSATGYFSQAISFHLVKPFQKGTPGKRGETQSERVCCFFRFRDQEFLKFLIFAKSETKIHKFKDF